MTVGVYDVPADERWLVERLGRALVVRGGLRFTSVYPVGSATPHRRPGAPPQAIGFLPPVSR